MSNKVKIVIIGAGPASYAFAYFIKKYYGEYFDIIIIESGKNLDERLKDLNVDNTAVICGSGGAGTVSDCKYSGPPAGSGIFEININELQNSYYEIINLLKSILIIDDDDNYKNYNDKFEKFIKECKEYLGDENMSMEEFERNNNNKNNKNKDFNLKLYPSLVLDKHKDAVKIIKHFENFLNENIIFKHQVIDIEQNKDKTYKVSYKSMNDEIFVIDNTKYIFMGMGRFGALQLKNFKIFNSNNDNDILLEQRLELGVRVDVNSCKELQDALFIHKEKNGLHADPKYTFNSNVIMNGEEINIETRTFCVCIPSKDKNKQGYVVCSNDINTNIETWSGSSSVSELESRKESEFVKEGSNLGIIVRFSNNDIIKRLHNYYQNKNKNIKNKKNYNFEIDMSMDTHENVKHFKKIFPKEICNIIYDSIIRMINCITGKTVTGKIKMFGPCLEGTGIYANYNKQSLQLHNHPNIYGGGDCIGFVRGLLQAFVTGHLAAKSLVSTNLYNNLKEKGLLHNNDLQNILLPQLEYNKVIHNGNIKNTTCYSSIFLGMKNDLFKIIHDNDEKIRDRADKILEYMHKVQYVGNDGNLGIIHEIHHFFLNKSTAKKGILHHITQDSLIQYLLLCNLIESKKDDISSKVIKLIEENDNYKLILDDKELMNKIVDNIKKTFKSHEYKACVLSLRTRTGLSEKEREKYIDILVMQPAFKIIAITKEIYNSQQDQDKIQLLHDMERYIVALTCSFLDTFFNHVLDENTIYSNGIKLDLMLVRTKIETQEVKIESVNNNEEPLYLECHVKVNILNKTNRKIPVEYNIKKRIIQQLASLFEGDNALINDIFNILAVSINLLKHPKYGQQFFLTFRTDTKNQMEYLRKNFSKIINNTLLIINNIGKELSNYSYEVITDSEFVIYDNNRDLDKPWFPIEKGFMNENYKKFIDKFIHNQNKIIIATSNRNKIDEIRRYFDKNENQNENKICFLHYNLKYNVTISDNLLDIETSAIRKAECFYEKFKIPVLTETTGLLLEGTNNFPGALTKLVLENMTFNIFAKTYKDMNVIVKTCFVFYDGINFNIFETDIKCKIVEEKGKGGFGWDSIVAPSDNNDDNKTFALMLEEEKLKIFPRINALMKFVNFYTHEK
jgi:non-canonical purine NTP pyrophosphatase (RdgB/HAM1 family)